MDQCEESQAQSDESPTEEAPAIQYNQTPEYLQRKLYFLLEQLKIMHADLPE